MEPIKIIQTGGTIDKDYPRTTGGYAFEISECAAERIARKIYPESRIQFVSVCKKDSQDIDDRDRESLAAACKVGDCMRILITHGTDTMIDTARYLTEKLSPGKFVILTGAFKPFTFKDTDAEFNVGFALAALQLLPQPGVYLAMNGEIFPSSGVRRNQTTGRFEKVSVPL